MKFTFISNPNQISQRTININLILFKFFISYKAICMYINSPHALTFIYMLEHKLHFFLCNVTAHRDADTHYINCLCARHTCECDVFTKSKPQRKIPIYTHTQHAILQINARKQSAIYNFKFVTTHTRRQILNRK